MVMKETGIMTDRGTVKHKKVVVGFGITAVGNIGWFKTFPSTISCIDSSNEPSFGTEIVYIE